LEVEGFEVRGGTKRGEERNEFFDSLEGIVKFFDPGEKFP